MFKFKSLKLKTKKDFRIAENLKNKGYKIIDIGIDSILLEKEVKNE
jgi:hypothetical protein